VLVSIGLFHAVASAQSAAVLERGKVLMNGIVACGNCHVARGPQGQPLFDKGLSGGMVFDEPPFRAVASNITPDRATGIGAWTDAQLAYTRQVLDNLPGRKDVEARLRELMEQLETLEELLPDAADVEIDESMVLDLSGHQSSELEVVLEGGSMPTPAMVAWARELQVGSWYMLDRGGHTEPVQLTWHGLRKQLSLFVTPQGRCVLFQQHRLASYLQAGLIVPAQDEALTVRATRSALAKLDVDASRLLS
jgi:hypothetical protein